MKLTNIGGHKDLEAYVSHKLSEYGRSEKSFETLFELMFSESENTMIETSDGYRIRRESYGEVKASVLSAAPSLLLALGELPHDAIVGLYMSNSPAWIRVFWEILACGYRPLLMNKSLPLPLLEEILAEHAVAAVISDGERFSVPTLSSETALLPADAPLSPRPFGTEVLFMSSGTTERVKLCAYTGENFYYQVCDSAGIIAACPAIKAHYMGELKQLVLLPLYHVFGFIAVYLWFCFFSRTLVFPKDLSPVTIQNTVKKHAVTHVFAVPMVWERVARAAVRTVRDRGERTERRFRRALSVANRSRLLGGTVSRLAFREVREGLFGDSIRCLISGGGGVDGSVLAFFNGIGYPLFNGYGMTELGITSVETSSVRAKRNLGAIGVPLGTAEYLRDEKTGELLVRGRARASRIACGGESVTTDFDAFFHTNDLVSLREGRYYHEGRMDDLINGADGELLNPTLIEPALSVPGCGALCLFADGAGKPVLLASVPGCFSEAGMTAILDALEDSVARAGLSSSVRRVCITTDPLTEAGEFKISRRRVSRRFAAGELTLIDRATVGEQLERLSGALADEITALFAEALERKKEDISPDDGFFSDLDGTSLDYFTLLDLLRSKYGVTPSESEQKKLLTVRDFCNFIKTSV